MLAAKRGGRAERLFMTGHPVLLALLVATTACGKAPSAAARPLIPFPLSHPALGCFEIRYRGDSVRGALPAPDSVHAHVPRISSRSWIDTIALLPNLVPPELRGGTDLAVYSVMTNWLSQTGAAARWGPQGDSVIIELGHTFEGTTITAVVTPTGLLGGAVSRSDDLTDTYSGVVGTRRTCFGYRAPAS